MIHSFIYVGIHTTIKKKRQSLMSRSLHFGKREKERERKNSKENIYSKVLIKSMKKAKARQISNRVF